MSRTALATLVLVVGLAGLLAVSVAGAGHPAVVANHSQVVPAANTSNALGIEGPSHQRYVEADLDVAAATAVSTERLRGDHDARTFEYRYEGAAQEKRVEVVTATVEDAERRLDRLGQAQAQLYRAYANRSVSRATLVRRLAVIQAESERVGNLHDAVYETVGEDFGTSLPVSLDRRVSALRANVVGLPAPVSSAFVAGVTGESDAFRAYAAASETGLILASVDAEGYVRQATELSAYAPDRPNQFDGSITDAYERALGLYPWVASEALNGPNLVERAGGIYRVTAQHPHGELTTYLHGGSGAVFHEIQRKQPEAVPVTRTVHNETASLRITIEPTTESGPMRVTVTDPDGSPVRATVSINRQVVGTTDADGHLWTIQPAGGFRVNATAEGGSVVVTGP